MTPSDLSDTGGASGGPALAARAHAVAARLQAAGHTAYWAGGCVRDMLLGRDPVDYDIATAAIPADVLALFPEGVAVGRAFGVVRVPWEGAWFEVATFRHDHSYRDGRHPESISFSTPPEDAARRDFTINALFYDPLADRVYDFVGGRVDLEARLIRAVGDPRRRFAEDHLRLLRAVRFASTLDFGIEAATAAAIRECADRIVHISAERIRDELTRLLTKAPRAGAALQLLDHAGLLAPILPEIAAMKGVAQPPEFHPEGDVFTHTALMLDLLDRPSLRLAFSVLLHDVGKPPTATHDGDRIRFNRHAIVGAEMADAILRRLRFSNDDREAIMHAVAHHMRFGDVPRMKRSTLRRLVGHPLFPMELELHRIDCLASHRKTDAYDALQAFRRELSNEPVLPPAWVNGRDVIRLGVPEGPEVGAWLRRAYDAQIEGQFDSREALLAWLARELGGAIVPPPS